MAGAIACAMWQVILPDVLSNYFRGAATSSDSSTSGDMSCALCTKEAECLLNTVLTFTAIAIELALPRFSRIEASTKPDAARKTLPPFYCNPNTEMGKFETHESSELFER